jgi:hypothetical protein
MYLISLPQITDPRDFVRKAKVEREVIALQTALEDHTRAQCVYARYINTQIRIHTETYSAIAMQRTARSRIARVRSVRLCYRPYTQVFAEIVSAVRVCASLLVTVGPITVVRGVRYALAVLFHASREERALRGGGLVPAAHRLHVWDVPGPSFAHTEVAYVLCICFSSVALALACVNGIVSFTHADQRAAFRDSFPRHTYTRVHRLRVFSSCPALRLRSLGRRHCMYTRYLCTLACYTYGHTQRPRLVRSRT